MVGGTQRKPGNTKRNGRASIYKRVAYACVLVIAVIAIGTLGFHFFEHYSYVESFYMISMLATTEGLAVTPTGDAGMVFTAVMAFISVGAVFFSLGYIFGPILKQVLMLEEKEERAITEYARRIGRRNRQ